MIYKRKNKGVCSLYTEITINDDGIIEYLNIAGGCNGNLKGICMLIKGMNAQDAATRLEGLTCGNKSTSCPDQIAITIREALNQS